MYESELYKETFEPRVTLIPQICAFRFMFYLADGAIALASDHHIVHENGEKKRIPVLFVSRDNGMSWTEEVRGANWHVAVKSPYSGEWISFFDDSANVSVCRSKYGPQGPFTEPEKISAENFTMARQPLALKSRKRWIVAGQDYVNGKPCPASLFISDDDGHTWRNVKVKPVPRNDKISYPHKGLLWVDSGTEPCVAETRTGRLIMLLRTSSYVHYVTYSDNGGDTWTDPEPTQFYSSATMPGIYTLSDGRLLAVWNNTVPYPELDHSTQPEINVDNRDGRGEDVFTNRDALHAALSDDDGKTWYGFREIFLNPIRNAGDWRTCGRVLEPDKSTHQNQVFELPKNKVLVHAGQHPRVSSVFVFDLDFLKVKTRSWDFRNGLDDWSVQGYYKSLSGSHCVTSVDGKWYPDGGHCAWNRYPSAQLMPSPDGGRDGRRYEEALLIARHSGDDRKLSDIEGATWNFPGSRSGTLTIELTVPEGSGGLRVTLADRWINPTDPYAGEYGHFSFVVAGDGTVDGKPLVMPSKRAVVELAYDIESDVLHIRGGLGELTLGKTQQIAPPLGRTFQISYLHLQTAAQTPDPVGAYIHRTNFAAEK